MTGGRPLWPGFVKVWVSRMCMTVARFSFLMSNSINLCFACQHGYRVSSIVLVYSEGVVVARESAQYTKVQSLVHTLERNGKRFFCNSEFHGFNRSSDSNLTTIFRR